MSQYPESTRLYSEVFLSDILYTQYPPLVYNWQGYHTSFFRKDSPSFLLSVLFKICCPFCPFFSLFVLIVLLVLINSFLSFYVLLVDYILEWLS